MKLVLDALVVGWLALALPAQDVAAKLAELDGARGARLEQLVGELTKLGRSAGDAALAPNFAELALEARRVRSSLARDHASAEALPAALANLADPDLVVRANLCALLGSPRLGAERVEERAAALEVAAQRWPEANARASALTALAALDHAAAAQALARLVPACTGAEQVEAARLLAGHARGRAALLELVASALRGDTKAVAGEALVQLVAACGTALADVEAGGEAPADRALFALAARHPDAQVRDAGALALERFLDRCVTLGDPQRASRTLEALEQAGIERGDLLARRAVLELTSEKGAAKALELARALAKASPVSDDPRSRTTLARARLIETAALFALSRGKEAEPALAQAENALVSLRAERWDLRAREDRADFDARATDDLLMTAVVPLWRTLVALADGAAPDSLAVLELARRADVALLEAQLEISRVAWNATLSHDDVLRHPLGPLVLALDGGAADALGERALELERDLCRACASVCGGGLPGFEPFEGLDTRLADALADPERRKLLVRIQDARRESALGYIDRETERLDRAQLAVDPTRLMELDVLRLQVRRMFQRETEEGDAALLRQRGVSRAGLAFAERNREQGRAESARRIAERAGVDLEALRGRLDELTLARYVAAAESALGGALMDLERGEEAEQVFERALGRLDGALREVRTREDSSAERVVQAQRAGMLTSLAVNANVKLRASEKALEYFERAYELDQSDFMRVMLACYRARAGRRDEARAALADLRVLPANYYNLACTWALLGEHELALDYLARDLAEMRTQPGARERQQNWAKGDPDLESLRGDPRFEALVATEAKK